MAKPKKPHKGLCQYQLEWEQAPEFKDWITRCKGDPKRAQCTRCNVSFDIANMGKYAVLSHMEGKKHKKNGTLQAPRNSLAAFGFTRSNTPGVSECLTQGVPDIPLPPPPTAATTNKVTDFVSKESVLRAEVRWVLRLIVNHHSYNSSSDAAEVLQDMFPDSAIAKQFKCGERKAAYLAVFGIAEYFLSLLKDRVTGPFTMMFDESLNKKLQQKQMDIHVRFWDQELNQVVSRYFGSQFLGHGTAEMLMDHFAEGVLKSGVNVKDLVQIGMDGPNVNWKFHDSMKQKLHDDYDTWLLNIGSCGLHVVHNSFKGGMKATGWELCSLLGALYYLLKDSPARREDFVRLSEATILPLKFVNHRWLENVPVVQRAILIWDVVESYVKQVNLKKLPDPKNKSFAIIRQATQDRQLLAKLHFFKCMSSLLQPFLAKYQTDRPMVPFLVEDLCLLLRSIMRRFVKSDLLECSNEALVKINVSDVANHVELRHVDIGFAAEKLRASKASESQVRQFKMDAKKCMITILEKIMAKCPVAFSLARYLACLDPVRMASKPRSCTTKFRRLLTMLVHAKRVKEDDCDVLMQQFSTFLDCIPMFGLDKFEKFDSSAARVDTLFAECMSSDKYDQLYAVTKLLLVLSHGQSSVERGFSVNKEVIVENMSEQSLIAQRVICDHVNSVGGVMKVDLTQPLLKSARASSLRYTNYLELEREKKKSEVQNNKRKRLLEDIGDLKVKKARLNTDQKSLFDTADNYLERASECPKQTSLLTHALALRKSAKEKSHEIEIVEKDLASKLEELKKV